MLKFVVTLKSGGDFKAYDAITLCRQVARHLTIPHEFICMTDVKINHPWVTEVKLLNNYPGWWSMVEMFRNVGQVIASGLDMIVLDNIDRLGELSKTCPKGTFYMARPQPRAFRNGEKWCSGLQLWNGDFRWLYNDFHFPTHSLWKREQVYTYKKLEAKGIKIKAVQDYFNGYYSYKNDCRSGKPEDARVVLFHGDPRPCNCNKRWVKEVYRNEDEGIHPFEKMKETWECYP